MTDPAAGVTAIVAAAGMGLFCAAVGDRFYAVVLGGLAVFGIVGAIFAQF